MAIRSGFFNSVNGDRKYDARDVSRLFDGMITDGVFLHWGNHFAMEPASSGLSVIVKSGRCWFNHAWVENDSNYTATFSMADPALSRTDAIVVEIDERDEYRRGTIKIIKGTAGGGNPTITKTEQVHQYVLAYVTIPSAATSLTASAISIKVGQGECPFAAGILDRVPIDEIWAQWNASFNEWFVSAQNTFSTEWTELKNEFNTEWAGLQNQFNTEWQERKDAYDAWLEALQNELTDNVAINLYNKIEEVNTTLTNKIEDLAASVQDTIDTSINEIFNPNGGKYERILCTDVFVTNSTFSPRTGILPVENSADDFINVLIIGPGGDGGVGDQNTGGGGGGGGYVAYKSGRMRKLLSDFPSGIPVTITESVTSLGTFLSAAKGENGSMFAGGRGGSGGGGGGGGGTTSGVGGGGGGGQFSGGGGGGGRGSPLQAGGGGGGGVSGGGGGSGGNGKYTDLKGRDGTSGIPEVSIESIVGGNGGSDGGGGGGGAGTSAYGSSGGSSNSTGNVCSGGSGGNGTPKTISANFFDGTYPIFGGAGGGGGGGGGGGVGGGRGGNGMDGNYYFGKSCVGNGGNGGTGGGGVYILGGGGGGGGGVFGPGGDGGSVTATQNNIPSGGGGGGGYGGPGGHGAYAGSSQFPSFGTDGIGYGTGGGGGQYLSYSGKGHSGIVIVKYYGYILKGE